MIGLQSRVFLSGKSEGRRVIREVLILNYDPEELELVRPASRA
jgi:hypothetical protein